MNKERQRLTERIKTLTARYNELVRGRVMASPKAIRIQNEIKALTQQLEAMDRDAAERLALSKAPIDDVLEVIAIPLLADVMNDLVAGVDGMLRRNGCQETVFGDYVRTIQRAAMAMVDTLSGTKDDLPKLLEVNDTLVDAVKKKLMTFIKQHLNITK